MKRKDHAGVWVPPPLVYVLALLAGVVLHSARSWPISDQYPIGMPVAGFFTIAIAVAIGLASVFSFRSANTTILPAGRPTTSIVNRGPYRFTRNPMYLAMACAYLGLAIWLNNMWALVLLPVVVAAIDVLVIRREERYLTEKFGDAYLQYCARVRRWI